MTIDVIAQARRRVRRRIATVVVAVLTVAGLVYPAGRYVNAHLDPPGAAPPAAAGPRPIGPSPIGPAEGALLPPDVVWGRVAGVDLPASAATGPARSRDGLARGFAHTRAGAVVAVLHLLVRTTPQVGPAVFAPTLTDQVTGVHAAAMRTFVAAAYEQGSVALGVAYGRALGDLPARFAAVRVETYTPGNAAVSVVTAADAAGVRRYAATTATVAWTGSDWSLVAPPEGRWDSAVRILEPTEVAGYPPLPGRG